MSRTELRLVTPSAQSVEPPVRRLLKIPEFAAVLNVSERECYRVVSRLRRGAFRVGRGIRVDVDEALESMRQHPEERP